VARLNVEALRVPPHSLEAEQSVIGALLVDNHAFDRVSFLQPSHFYRDDHRRIYTVVRDMLDKGRPADLVLVIERLQASGDIEKTGGPAYIAGLIQNTPSALNVHRYAELVRDKAILRALLQRSVEVGEKVWQPGADPKALAEEAEVAFLSVLDDGRKSEEFVHIGQAVAEYLDWQEAHPRGIETGLTDLDALTGGLYPGHLVIVAGRPSMGKTALALQFSEVICAVRPGLMFSLESTRKELAGRLINWHRHRLGRDGAVDQIDRLKLFIDDSSSVSPGFIRSRARRMKRQHGLAYIVVDYLQLMRGKGDNREQEVSFISRELKAIAKEFEVPVVALSQLSRKVEERADKRPTMGDLRESGAIEQDADVILFPFRPDYYDKNFDGGLAEAEIIVAKNRGNGRTGTAKVSFSRNLNRFGDFMPGMQEAA
jgi:replicative DNA helicase